MTVYSSDEFFVNLIEVRCFFVFEIEGAYITRDGSEEDFFWVDHDLHGVISSAVRGSPILILIQARYLALVSSIILNNIGTYL